MVGAHNQQRSASVLKNVTEGQLTHGQFAGQTVVMRDVKEKMKELNVQLDNLCQVLNV